MKRIIKMAAQISSSTSTTKSKLQFYRRTLPESCISFSSKEGKEIFKEALQTGYMEGYFGLAAQFRTQDEPAYCGLSTLVMTLNTLEVDPKRVWKGPWRWYHESMLDCCVPLDVAAKNGVTFDELACLASCNTLSVRMVHVDSSVTVEAFRHVVKDLTRRDDEVLVVSYSRLVLGQTGDGHFSPVGGYHEEQDLVLVLDTARFKYPPHWIPLSLLHEAMQACDKTTGQPRGFMKLRKNDNVPLILFRVGETLSLSSLGKRNADTQVSDSHISPLDSFLDTWTAWMNEPSKETSYLGILGLAANTMIRSLGKLNEQDSILTTQVDVSCYEGLSATHGCVIEELLENLESLPLYGFVEKQLEKNGLVPCLHKEVNEYEEKPFPCELAKPGLCSKKASVNLANCGDDDTTCITGKRRRPKLLPAHLVTMLICAWPAFKCSVTNCSVLRKALLAELCKMSTVLQDEVAQLSKQFNSILNFGKCGNCSCEN